MAETKSDAVYSASVWGRTDFDNGSETAVSFADVMSQDLAIELQAKEVDWQGVLTDSEMLAACAEDVLIPPDLQDTNSDEILAQMLQLQFNQEYDRALGKEEAKYNGTSKVSVSYSNYRMIPKGSLLNDDSDSFEDDDLTSSAKEGWDSFEKAAKGSPNTSKSGFAKKEGSIITKHDTAVSGRKNACKAMELTSNIQMGDGGGFDMKLSNPVYNHLKQFSMAEQKRAARLNDKHGKATATMALDPKSRLMLYRLVDNNVLERVNGVISTGKEAVILHAEGGTMDDVAVPKECAVKVFKTTLNEFKNRDKYIRDDFRFRNRFSKQNPRKVIHMWAEKEMHNLSRMHNANIACPRVVLLKKHMLVMSFIGRDGRAADKIRDAGLGPDHIQLAYKQTLDMMVAMYEKCNLIHADLSEYNILWFDKQCWFIDVSQAVEPTHPQALNFLFRDCCNVTHFFHKMGASDVLSAEQLFTRVCGMPFEGSKVDVMEQIRNYERDLEILTFDDPSIEQKRYPFDYCWQKTQDK